MPRLPPPKHAQFKPGQSGNPSGKPKLPAELRDHPKLTTEELQRVISKHFRMIYDQLEAALANPSTTTLELIIASTIKRAIKEGDISRAEYLFLRSLGKVKEAIEIPHHEPVVIQKLDGSTVELGVKSGGNKDEKEN